MSTPVKKETHIERRRFIDYIHGLIRFEVGKGEDDDKRLEVLSKIHYDLIYTEDLEKALNWKKQSKGVDELGMALEKLAKLSSEVAKAKGQVATLVNGINNNMTKKDILLLVEKVKEGAV